MAKQRSIITPKVRKLMDDGYRPWGIVIPAPEGAPPGSGVYQFKRGNDHASVVLTPKGRFIRGHETIKGQIKKL